MKIYTKKVKTQTAMRAGIKRSAQRIILIALMIIMLLSLAVLGQTASNETAHMSRPPEVKNSEAGKTIVPQAAPAFAQQAAAPTADHHTHLWSLEARSQVTDPMLPAIELPADLKQLLRDRELLVKEKDPSLLAPLYTEDALVLDAMAPIWFQGKRAVSFVANSLGSYPLVPQAYKVDGSAGYIVGTYSEGSGASLEHVSNFSLFIRKGADGKWRIAGETFTLKGPPVPKASTAEQLIAEMDAAGIKRAAVLSVAYWFGNPRRTVADEYAKVRAENDWLADQVGRFPARLIGFCSFNPIRDYALEELGRCAANPNFKGLKLHLGNSGVDVLNAQHVEKLRAVFRTANDKRFPIVVHLWTPGKYGREHAEAFLDQIIPAAPDIPIQIAHMAASGPDYHSDEAFEVYAAAAERGDPRMKNVYADIASMVTDNTQAKTMELVAKRLRQFGISRVLFASDRAPGGSNDTPAAAWKAFLRLRLSEDEFRTIASNMAPFLR